MFFFSNLRCIESNWKYEPTVTEGISVYIEDVLCSKLWIYGGCVQVSNIISIVMGLYIYLRYVYLYKIYLFNKIRSWKSHG